MPIVRKVFMSILRCIGCGFLGVLGALILGGFASILAAVFGPKSVGVFGPGVFLLVAALWGIPGGFALGAIYGAIRTLTSLKKGQAALIATSVIGAPLLLMFLLSILSDALQPPPPKIQPISQQTIGVGRPLSISVTVENAPWWKDRLRYSLGPSSPVGSVIDAKTGVFTWTPTEAQRTGKHDVVVLVNDPEGKTAQMTFEVNVMPRLRELAIDLGGGLKMEVVLIPAGDFLMGSPDSDKDAIPSEKPQHRVRITKPFYLGKYLVTQEQWQAVMDDKPSHFKGPKNPVELVSWDDIQRFFQKLNVKIGTQNGKFALPTEAQWEYACRAGGTTRYCFGDEVSGLGEYAWFDENSGSKTHPVGEKKPNAWGLHDMHGTIWEWCQDWYADVGYYANSPTDDPTGPATGLARVCRSGSWDGPAGNCRSARRDPYAPAHREINMGFRVSRVLVDK